MASACKCDRCGKFFIPESKDLIIKRVILGRHALYNSSENGIRTIKYYDLCEECFNFLEIFLEGDQNEMSNIV